MELMDTFAAAVSAVTPLDLMPSSKDPTGIMLPQKPFHYCKRSDRHPCFILITHYFIDSNFFLVPGLFPKAVEYKSFNRVSNPYECDIAGNYFFSSKSLQYSVILLQLGTVFK